ncbi:MAG: hypothetical protein U0892_16295 [Pirellulales bacterium]
MDLILTAGNNTVAFNNGAVGTVTAATATQLTVSLGTKPTTMGNLTAVVTTNSKSSGSAVQVATAKPVVTSSTTNLSAGSSTITINGFGFDSVTPGNNVVTFNGIATGTVTAATATALTVTFGTRPTTGSLTAIVTRDGVTSGTAVQVANITPSVTSSTANFAANSSTITINGYGFSSTANQNTIVFNNNAVGTVTSATPTSLTVSFGTKPRSAGSLTAVVTIGSVNSGSATQIATVIPVITSAVTAQGVDANTVAVAGFGFDTTAGNNTVVLSNGATGTVTAATATTMTITFGTKPTTAGNLTAVVTSNSVSSGAPVQIASAKPVITQSTSSLAMNATTMTINGLGFDTTAANNTVVFSGGITGNITSASATSLTITFTSSVTAGNLTAVVTTNGVSSGTAVQVATVAPIVMSSSANLAGNATSITIYGSGFSTTAASNTVAFSSGAVGTVASATATSLTVNFTTKPTAGALTAVVTTGSASSGSAVTVANVTPYVTTSTANLSITANTVTIAGFGFSTTAGNNTVTFNNGATGTVTTATATQLTVTFGTKPTSVGSLTAVVTTNSISSGSAVQVATVAPVVTASTANMNADATTMTIAGFGFSTTAGNNSVTFNNGAVGTVTAATATQLTVTFSTKPSAGNLTAIVTIGGSNSGTAVQVASVLPVITSAITNLAANATHRDDQRIRLQHDTGQQYCDVQQRCDGNCVGCDSNLADGDLRYETEQRGQPNGYRDYEHEGKRGCSSSGNRHSGDHQQYSQPRCIGEHHYDCRIRFQYDGQSKRGDVQQRSHGYSDRCYQDVTNGDLRNKTDVARQHDSHGFDQFDLERFERASGHSDSGRNREYGYHRLQRSDHYDCRCRIQYNGEPERSDLQQRCDWYGNSGNSYITDCDYVSGSVRR